MIISKGDQITGLEGICLGSGLPDLAYAGLGMWEGIRRMMSPVLGWAGSGDGVTREKLLGGGLDQDQKQRLVWENEDLGR